MTFTESLILKIIGALLTAVFSYIIGKKIIVEHRIGGGWSFGKRIIVISWFFKWGTLIIFPWIYEGVLQPQQIAIMWLSSFLFGHWILRPIGKLLIS